MKLFIKNNIKFIIVIVICLIGSSITTLATNYIFNSNEVSYDNTESGLHADSVQGAIDEVFQHATDYSELKTRMTTLENQIYPVGSIYISVNSTNPSTLFGGTWEAFATGRTLIGVGSNGTDTYAINNTGGASTHTITTNNMPSHAHNYTDYYANDTSGSTALSANQLPSISGSIQMHSSNASTNIANTTGSFSCGSWANKYFYTDSGNVSTYAKSCGNFTFSFGGNQGHTHTVSNTSATRTTVAAGSGTALSTIDPYITVYMWKRTA